MSELSQIIRIPVSKDFYQIAENFIQGVNIANRGVFDGDKRKQLVGMIGQITFYHFVFGKLPVLSTGFDGGIDLTYKNHTIDVKTMERKVFVRREYVNNFIALQKDFDCDVLMFLSYNSKASEFGTIEICGWIYKREIDEKANFYPKGTERKRSDGTTFELTEDLYEIPIEKLNPFKNETRSN